MFRLPYTHAVRLLIYATIGILAMPGFADAIMWRLPDKIDGVLYVDHFGGCYFYNDTGLMNVSDKDRDLVAPHTNKLVSLSVTGITQWSNPGDVRLDRFTIDDPARDAVSNRNRLQLDAALQKNGRASSIKLRVTNRGAKTFSLYPGIIDFFCIAGGSSAKDKRLSLDVSDGPSTLIGQERVFGCPQRTWRGTYSNDQGILTWTVRDGHEIKDKIDLLPGKNTDIFIDFERASGSYEVLFGYKVLRDSSFETSMKINDLVLPVISNAVVLDSNYFYQFAWWHRVLLSGLFGFLLYRLVQRLRRGKGIAIYSA